MTNVRNKVKIMTISALLCALGILIPMTFPRIRLDAFGASYTLASHVPVIIAMFISPTVAAFVASVTTIGFFIGGFPIVVVLRALTHIIFVMTGALMLKKRPHMLQSMRSIVLYTVFLSFIHGVAEVAAVALFNWANGISITDYDNGFFTTVILLVGVGTLIHSLVDFTIAVLVWKPLQQIISIPANANIRLKHSR
jgi:niacin transporter